jgi:hypothetical protein
MPGKYDKSILTMQKYTPFSNASEASLPEFVKWFRLTYGLPYVGDRIHFTTTYNRKYFCNKCVKDRGFKLKLETTQKTILVTPDQVEAASQDRYVKELAQKHNYGVQIIMPFNP